jgi:hypothetical protein
MTKDKNPANVAIIAVVSPVTWCARIRHHVIRPAGERKG